MIIYVLQRLLGLVPVLFGISVVIFLTMKLIPGDVARALLGPMATDQSLAQLRHALGLDEAIYVQYGKWLWRALHGDLGLSPIVHKPVVELLLPKFGNTLILAGASFFLAVVGGVGGRRAGGGPPADRGGPRHDGRLARRRQHAALLARPGAHRVLRDQPALAAEPRHVLLARDGGLDDLLAHLILPAVATAAAPGAIIARMTRASVLEILGQDYIKVARSKGLSERAVLRLHALRVAWPPILTISGLQLGYLLGGAVFTEEVFGWPGLGRQLVSSVHRARRAGGPGRGALHRAVVRDGQPRGGPAEPLPRPALAAGLTRGHHLDRARRDPVAPRAPAAARGALGSSARVFARDRQAMVGLVIIAIVGGAAARRAAHQPVGSAGLGRRGAAVTDRHGRATCSAPTSRGATS